MAPGRKAKAKATTAPPRAAAAGQEQGHATQLLDVLDLVLQHAPALQDVRQFCRLQQVSQAASGTAVLHAPGQLQVKLQLGTAAAAVKAAPWIARHARLVGDLSVAAGPGSFDDQETTDAAAARAAVLAAFQQAVAGQPDDPAAPAGPPAPAGEARGMQVHKLSLAGAPAIAADLLQLAAGTQLTQLTLSVGNDFMYYDDVQDEEDPDDAEEETPAPTGDIARLVEMVGSLPSLRHLSFWSYRPALFQCLPWLSALTHFWCNCMSRADLVLPLLPSQLLHLDLFIEDGFPCGQLDLQHCQSLTELHLGDVVELGGEAKLPASSLQVLSAGRLGSAAPLLACSSLRQLALSNPLSAARLRQLTALTNLTSVSLVCDHPPASVAEVWGELPLRDLALCVSPPFSAHFMRTLSHLGNATHLIRLDLDILGDSAQTMDKLALHLAACLPRLRLLEELKLAKGNLDNAGVPLAATSYELEAKMAALAMAIADLPCLQSLMVRGFLWSAAAQQLSSAGTQLTRLVVGDARVSLKAILRMAQLRSLQLINVHGLDDACLKVAGRHLRRLTQLSFTDAVALTLTAVRQLAQLPSLDQLTFRSDGAQGYKFAAADVRGALRAAGSCAPLQHVTVSHGGGCFLC